jgi:hypothetical protein
MSAAAIGTCQVALFHDPKIRCAPCGPVLLRVFG